MAGCKKVTSGPCIGVKYKYQVNENSSRNSIVTLDYVIPDISI